MTRSSEHSIVPTGLQHSSDVMWRLVSLVQDMDCWHCYRNDEQTDRDSRSRQRMVCFAQIAPAMRMHIQGLDVLCRPYSSAQAPDRLGPIHRPSRIKRKIATNRSLTIAAARREIQSLSCSARLRAPRRRSCALHSSCVRFGSKQK